MCIKCYFHLKGREKINHGEKETQSKFKGLSLTRQTSEYSLEYQELQTVKPRILGEGLAHCPLRPHSQNRTFQQRFITLESEIVPYAHLCPSLDYLGLTVVPAKGSFTQKASLRCPA